MLVIDDYNLTDSFAIDSFFEQIAESEIHNLHVILTARFVKFKRLEELALKGCLLHITKETFELKPNEIMAYYRTCGAVISNGTAQRLYAETEGWISALYLLLLEYVTYGSYTLSGSIYKLLENTIYRPLSNEAKNFLV